MFSIIKKQTGGALVGIILAVAIIAAIYFGSSFFLQESKKSELEDPLDSVTSLNKAKQEIARINEKTGQNNQEIGVILEEIEKNITPEEISTSTSESISTYTDASEAAIVFETDLDLTGWQELERENENFKIKYHKDWYYAVNRNEAAQDGYDMIFGFGEDENIWETLPPYVVELIVANENMDWKYDGYIAELGIKNGKKYALRTSEKEKYQAIINAMASTFQFIIK